MPNKTVMLVDDSLTVRHVMRLALEMAGFSVLEAHDGEDALRQMDGRRLSAVIMDIAMPKLDGMGCLQAMRAKHDYRFTPVVMMTTESKPERKEQAKALGVVAWAHKPCAPSEVVDVLKRITT